MLRPELLDARVDRARDLVRLLDAAAPGQRQGLDRVLDRDEAMRVVEALNDLRISLAATIDSATLLRDRGAPDEQRRDAVGLMDALAWLQGGLIEFVDIDGDG